MDHLLLQDFNFSFRKPALICCDNQSTIHIAANPTFHERTKHIELNCHMVREKVSQGTVKLLLVFTIVQVVDVFTKPLLLVLFKTLNLSWDERPPCDERPPFFSLQGYYETLKNWLI